MAACVKILKKCYFALEMPIEEGSDILNCSAFFVKRMYAGLSPD